MRYGFQIRTLPDAVVGFFDRTTDMTSDEARKAAMVEFSKTSELIAEIRHTNRARAMITHPNLVDYHGDLKLLLSALDPGHPYFFRESVAPHKLPQFEAALKRWGRT